jgi:mannose-1-phosphate guanylyltransferase
MFTRGTDHRNGVQARPRRSRPICDSELLRPDVGGVVLAGVHSWGDCLFEQLAARALVPVAGRPLIVHVLSWLREAGVVQASVCANSDTTVVRRCLGDGGWLRIVLDYYQDVMPRGPAGCVRDVAFQSGRRILVVVEGTAFPRIDLPQLLRVHAATAAALTVVVSGPSGANGGFEDALQPVGVYIFSPEAIEHIPATGYQDIKEMLIPRLYERGARVLPHVVAGGSAPRVMEAASYMAVNEWALQRAVFDQMPWDGYARRADALVHRTATISPFAQLIGTVLLGPGSAVDTEAIIAGPTTLGAGSIVGAKAVISRSAIWNRCVVGAGAVIDHCVIPDEAEIRAGSVLRDTVWMALRRPRSAVSERLDRLWQRDASGATASECEESRSDRTMSRRDEKRRSYQGHLPRGGKASLRAAASLGIPKGL